MSELIMQTMNSREIAELTGRNHKEVMRSIRTMEPAWRKVNGRNFALVEYIDVKGEKRPVYQLTKTECLYIATKFNDEARARLIIRWEELECMRSETQILETQDNTAALLEMSLTAMQVRDHIVRETLRRQIMAMKGEGIQIQQEIGEPKSEYTDAVHAILHQACNTYYLSYMPTFMNHKGLATAAAILTLALDYIKLHKIPLHKGYCRNRFCYDLSHWADVREIKYIPKDGRNLRDKLRQYDKGSFITELVKLKNAGNQNVKQPKRDNEPNY
jgi:phage regulator Rha-like protein